MPQSIFVQVGQCGNQIGFGFWENALKEYELHGTNMHEMNYFFKPTPDGNNDEKLEVNYKARGVLVDMEENAISQGLRGRLGSLFSKDQILTDVSGSGNNWAVGHINYGSKHEDTIRNLIRREAEQCDQLETFLLTFSLGGGTGSGLGTSILNHLQDDYESCPRIVFAAFPSLIDDVVTSPYNAILANKELIENASLVIPFENQTLNAICQKHFKKQSLPVYSSKAAIPKGDNLLRSTVSQEKPFDDMNRIIAYSILDLTSSCRFYGHFNLDMADILTNLVPHPGLHYAIPSLAPLSPDDSSSSNKLLKDILSGSNQLTSCAVKNRKLISHILVARGLTFSYEIANKINERMEIDFRYYRPYDGALRIGICDIPRLDFEHSLLQLSNCTSILSTFGAMKNNFSKMFEKKAHLHHFLDVDPDIEAKFEDAVEKLDSVMTEYMKLENEQDDVDNLRPSVL